MNKDKEMMVEQALSDDKLDNVTGGFSYPISSSEIPVVSEIAEAIDKTIEQTALNLSLK